MDGESNNNEDDVKVKEKGTNFQEAGKVNHQGG